MSSNKIRLNPQTIELRKTAHDSGTSSSETFGNFWTRAEMGFLLIGLRVSYSRLRICESCRFPCRSVNGNRSEYLSPVENGTPLTQHNRVITNKEATLTTPVFTAMCDPLGKSHKANSLFRETHPWYLNNPISHQTQYVCECSFHAWTHVTFFAYFQA